MSIERELFRKFTNESINESLKQDVEELTGLETGTYYRVDGTRVSVKYGASPINAHCNLEDLGKKLEKKGYKVHYSHFYIDATKNESVEAVKTIDSDIGKYPKAFKEGDIAFLDDGRKVQVLDKLGKKYKVKSMYGSRHEFYVDDYRLIILDSPQNEEIVENSYAVVKAIDNGIGKAPTAIDVMKGYVTFDEAQTAINDMSTDQEFADDPTLMLFVAYEKDGKLFNAVTGDIVNIPEEKSEAISYGRTVQFQNIGFGFNVETGSSEDSKITLSLMGFSSNTESDVEYISNELALDYSLPAEKSKELNDKVVAVKQEILQELLTISNEFDSKVAEIMEKHGFRKASK